MAKTLEDFVITKNLPRERSFMFGKSVEKKENRGIVMCFLVAVYTITSIVFLLQVNQYTQDIYDFPYLVSSQARIMKSRLYDFRSLTPVLFSSKDLNSTQLESALKLRKRFKDKALRLLKIAIAAARKNCRN